MTSPTKSVIGACASIVPALLAAWYIHAYGVNGAHWDHLMTAELFDRWYSGTLTLEFLLRPHLEHIKLFPRLIALALGLATRFNNIAEMYFQWGLLCATAGMLAAVLRMRVCAPDSGSRWLLALAPVTLILFSPRHHEAMLVGDGMITYLSLTAAIASIALLAGGRRPHPVAAAAAAFVASFSHANGFLAWPIGAAVLLLRPRDTDTPVWRAVLGWCAVAVAAVALYARHWPETAGSSLGFAAAHPLAVLGYIVEAAGVMFGQAARVQVAGGACALIVEAAVVTVAVRRYRRGAALPFGIWLIAFAAGCQVLIALGRVSMPTGTGIASRYAAFIGLALIGAWMAALEMVRWRALTMATLALVVVAGVMGDYDGLVSGPRERDGRLLAVQVLRTIEWQRDSDVATLLYPFPAEARRYAAMLERWHLNVFATPPRDVDAVPVAGAGEVHVDQLNWAPLDPRATIVVHAGDAISFSGWAVDTRRRAPFAEAWVRIDPAGLTLPIAYGLERPDVARTYHLRNAATGFAGIFVASALTPGRNTLTLEFASTSHRVVGSAIAIDLVP